MEYLLVGKIIGTFSLDGTLKIISTTSFEEERFKIGNILLLKKKDSEQVTSYQVEQFRKNGNIVFIKFKNIDSVDSANEYVHGEILTEKDSNKLPANNFYFCDLVGSKIIDQNNNDIGKVIEVVEFPAQITLKVQSSKIIYIPFIDQFIKNVDIKNKKIKIEAIEGLL